MTLLPNPSGRRDWYRAISDSASTGAGTDSCHRVLDRPPALTGVVDPAAQTVELRVAREGGLGELEEPGANHAPLVPEMRDGVQIEAAEVRFRLHDREALGIRLQHPVLDAVVHHLDEVSGAGRTNVQEPIGRCEGFEDRAPVLDGVALTARHEAVAHRETPHAAAGTRVDVADAPLCAARGARDRVVVVAVATVDDGVALAEQ